MNQHTKGRRRVAAGLVIAVLVAAAILSSRSPVVGQAIELTTGYDLSWWTVDGGGHTGDSSGTYTLSGTVGQPDAGVLAQGDYTLYGGFWSAVRTKLRVYLPLISRSQ